MGEGGPVQDDDTANYLIIPSDVQDLYQEYDKPSDLEWDEMFDLTPQDQLRIVVHKPEQSADD